jgi:hypothetical protein
LDTNEKADEAVAAEDVKQVVIDERGCRPNSEHQKVFIAEKTLGELDGFIDKLRDHEFLEQFEEEYGYLPDLTNKEFWQDHLANI